MDRFHKVSRSEPCPVCGKPDWCVVSNDGGTAICMRVESDRPHDRGGWVHVLKSIAPVRRVYAPPPVRRRVVDMARLFDGLGSYELGKQAGREECEQENKKEAASALIVRFA